MLFIKHHRKIFYTLFFLLTLLCILSYFTLTFFLDEEYSFGLIEHSYKQLININMLDVHPPTYYLILKFFINTTTFWTKSIFIQIIAARLFSFILFTLSIIFLFKILKEIHIKVNHNIQLLFFISLSGIQQYIFQIRMYELFTLFIIIELYELIKFNKSNKITHLTTAIFSALIASYTYYFAAICSGSFLLIEFIKCIFIYKKNIIKCFVLNIIYLTICIPLILLAFKQAVNRLFNKSMELNNYTITFRLLLKSFLQSNNKFTDVCMIILLLLFIYFYKFNNNNNIKILIKDILINYGISLIIVLLIYFLIHKEIYEPKFLFAQFTILMFLNISILINYINITKIKTLCTITISIILIITSSYTITMNTKIYWIPQNKDIAIVQHNTPVTYKRTNNTVPNQLMPIQESVYLKSTHKNLIITHVNNYKTLSNGLVNGNTKLFKETFNNVKIKNKSY